MYSEHGTHYLLLFDFIELALMKFCLVLKKNQLSQSGI